MCSNDLTLCAVDWKHMLHKWVTEHMRSLTTVVMFSLRNDPSPQTNVTAFPAHFLFYAGSCAPHCASQRPQVLWDNSVIFCPNSEAAAALFGLLHVICIKLWHGAYLDSHIFTTGFAVTSQHMEIVCPSAWFLFNSPQGLLRGPQLPTGPNTFYTG